MPGVTRIGPKRYRRLYIAEYRNRHVPVLTQEGLGERLGVSGMTVSRWERATDGSNPKKRASGTSEVSWAVMQAIADALALDDPGDLAHHPDELRPELILRNQPPEVVDQVIAFALRVRRK